MNTYEVLVTGVTGFVGSRLCEIAIERDFKVRRAVRYSDNKKNVITGEIGPETDWSGALKDVAAVVHLAARVHVMDDEALDPLSEFRRVNVDGTVNLARQAARAGVRRFIFISSVKVNGESTKPGKPFTIQDPPNPQDPYAVSKFEAEHYLRRVEKDTGLEVVIIRPPLVYGPGVKANFLRLMQAVQKGLPLPLGLVRNKRSLVALDNLVDLIKTCIQHPAAAGKTFLVSDGEDLSTPELIRKLAFGMGRSARLLPVPTVILKAAGRMAGRGAEVERLCGSLRVDISKTQEILGWYPPISIDSALQDTVRHFLTKAM